MSFQLDEATLAAMTQEARQCFLDEDAPEYLHLFEEGLRQRYQDPKFTDLLRAAHSLKGGAGLAQLESLRTLAHQIEDLLLAIQSQQVLDLNDAWALLEWGVTEVALLLNQARTSPTVTADGNLLATLADFVAAGAIAKGTPDNADPSFPQINPLSSSHTVASTGASTGASSLVQSALLGDLEACLLRVEALSSQSSPAAIAHDLATFCDEGILLGETLNLPWLVAGIEPLEALLVEAPPEVALEVAQLLVGQIRTQREQYLAEIGVGSQEVRDREDLSVPSDLLPSLQLEETPVLTDSKLDSQDAERTPNLSQLRIPLKRLEGMTNQIEELIFAQERLRLQQQLFDQANRRLRELTRQFEPIREQVQSVYDQLALTPWQARIPWGRGITPASPSLGFDALELDRYTALHSSLQVFQELMLRVQETRADLDFIHREVAADLDQVQGKLDALYSEVTQSRLVPFRVLAQRFLPQIQTLNRRYGKAVELQLEGEDTLVDQVLLEQLQTPLTHLLNNAFDHGIEPTAERLAHNKPERAQILLSAKVEHNQLTLQLRDDGCGIDLSRIYAQAIAQGLSPRDRNFEQYSSEQILSWIFQPNFSTAETISDLSGRGVGLDIVRAQIQRLRGTVQVETQAQQGTTFTLKLPLNLSLQSLLLLQLEYRTLALPSSTVLSTLLYSELEWESQNPPLVRWQGQIIPLADLADLMPCPGLPMVSLNPRVAIVLATAAGPLLIKGNALVSERQLIVKPFDETLLPPPYLAGCTILGNGEVIPVILPHGLALPSSPAPSMSDPAIPVQKTPTILIAEDSVATRRLLERLVSQVGYLPVVCRDGQEALDELYQRRGQIDLLISDVEMPRLNGFELLQKLRSDANLPQIPVILATSRTGDRHQQQAAQLGANAYLGKPIQAQELMATIQSLLAISVIQS